MYVNEMGKLEKQIQAEGIAALEALGCLVVQMNLSAIIIRGRRVRNPLIGFFDIFGWLPNGRGFAFEFKRPDAKPQKHEDKQAEWLEKALRYNVLAAKVSSVEEILAIVKPAMSECFT